jgi:O-antigen ligase
MPKKTTAVPAAAAPRPEGVEALLLPLGLLLALVLPFVVWLADSPEQLREVKLGLQALGATMALAGLSLGSLRRRPLTDLADLSPAGRLGAAALAAAIGFALVSGLTNLSRVDPLTATAVLSPLALLLAGTSRAGEAAAPRVLSGLMIAGAATGLLAGAQRYLGILRILPMVAPEPRFLAAALIGNPGDVAAALLFPAVLLWIRLTSVPGLRSRFVAAAGLAACLLGLGATEAIAPLGAFAAAVFFHTLMDLRARWRPFVAAVLLFAAAAGVTGAGRRALVKLNQLRRGETAKASTQRDIGVLAALEMIRARPLLGVGPGAFSNAFVPARLRAEVRTGRYLIHRSGYAHFDNAHSEPLTIAAENGLPSALLSLVALGAVATGLFGRPRGEGAARGPSAVSPDTLLALLASFAVLSLGSFPLRLALSAGPAAFAFGLAFRELSRAGFAEPSPSPRLAALLGVLALLTLGTAGLRFAAVSLQADGELRLQATDTFEGAERSDLNDSARRQLKRALALRPMSASGWIALGSTYRTDRDWENAFRAYVRSLSIEERTETDFNIGLVVLNGSAPEKATGFFRRALWILPRLADSLPPSVDAEALTRENRQTAQNLGAGARPPELPDGLTPGI